MRRFPITVSSIILLAALTGCSSAPGSCGGPVLPNLPALTLRSPLELFYEPQTVPGSRLMAVPTGVQYVAPSYSAPAAVCGCGGAPALMPGYVYGAAPAARVIDPCNPGAPTGDGTPQSIPAIRR